MPFCPQIVDIGKASGAASPAYAVVANKEKRVISVLERYVGCWLYLVLHTQQDIEQPRCCRCFIRDADAGIVELGHGFRGVEEDTASFLSCGNTKTRYWLQAVCQAKVVHHRHRPGVNLAIRHRRG
jgi:hypothetical protein